MSRCTSLVDAEPVRQHVEALRRRGMGYKTTATAAGVAWNTVSYLLYGNPAAGRGPGRRIHIMNAKKLLAVRFDVDLLKDQSQIEAVGTRRRLQALVLRGWTYEQLAERLDITPSRFRTLFMGYRHPRVQVRTYRKVVALHEDLWDQDPPLDTPTQRTSVLRTRLRAQRWGWVPTAAWDDIDDPDEEPKVAPQIEVVDEVAVHRVAAGGDSSGLTEAEKVEVVRLMLDRGASLSAAARAVRWSNKRVTEMVAA